MHGQGFSGRRAKLGRTVAVGSIAAALVVGGAASAFATTATSGRAPHPRPRRRTTCLPAGHDDVWPVWADGRPVREPGVAVWHDASGWHVRVTHDTLHDRVFSGEIRDDGRARRREGGAPRAATMPSRSVPTRTRSGFRFNNYGGIDGFDFATHCAPFLAFGFASDGHVVPAARVAIGAAGRHPARDPFVITRTA